MFRKALIALVVAGFVTDTATAGSNATVTPLLGGTLGSVINNDQAEGFSYVMPQNQTAGTPYNLYDNLPLSIGGGASAGQFGSFGSTGATIAFFDWSNPVAQWGDDLHGISAGGTGPAVVTNIRYTYFNNGNPLGGTPPTQFTVTHIIKLYEMVPPSQVPPVQSQIFKGHLEASILIPGLPAGGFTVEQKTITTTLNGSTIVTNRNFYPYTVTVQIDPVILKGSALWIKFEELGPAAPDTLWGTGGRPQYDPNLSFYSLDIGYSHDGLVYGLKNYFPSGANYNLFWPQLLRGAYVYGNMQVALNGFHIPAPAAISLLGLAGLLSLRRRRAAVSFMSLDHLAPVAWGSECR